MNDIIGSLNNIAKSNNITLAEAFLSISVIIMIDVSGSMMQVDNTEDHRSRYDIAKDELVKLQASIPGEIAVVSFSSTACFCSSGVPRYEGYETMVADVLNFVKVADSINGMRFILISDGEPTDEEDALLVARTFKNKIDTIFIGSKEDGGEEFLRKLANITGGKCETPRDASLIGSKTMLLLN